MAIVFIRTFIVYFVLLTVLRLTGKRQIGELQPSELVTTLILSQIASVPIVDDDIPLLHGIIPVCTVVCLEVISSFVTTKVPLMKRLFVGKPSVLIEKGRIKPDEMLKVRLNVEELMAQLRANGVGDISDVYYAVMEENGSISVILASSASPVTRSDAGVCQNERGLSRLIISDGCVNEQNLKAMGKSCGWLDKVLKEHGTVRKNVFLMTCNDAGETVIINKNGRKK